MALPSMPRGPDARGKRVALFGLSADPPTGPRGHQGLVRRLAGEGLFDEIWWAPLSPPLPPARTNPNPNLYRVLPVYRHAFSAKNSLAPFDHRIAMCRLNFGEGGGEGARVRVLPLEKELAERAGPSAKLGTVDIVAEVLSSCSGVQLSLVLGLDTARDLLAGRWQRGEELLSMVHKLHVLHRPGGSGGGGAAEEELHELPLAQRANCAQTQKIVFHSGPVGAASSSRVRAHCPSLRELLLPSLYPPAQHPLVAQGLLCAEVLAYMRDSGLYFYARRAWLWLLAVGAAGALAASLWLRLM